MALVFSSSISTSSADSHDECYCFGEVRRPGIYKFDVPGKDTLGRMLSAAGGLTQHAAPLVAITNPARTPPYFLVDLERKQDALDFELFQGDRLCAIRNATSETLKLGFPLNDRKCTVRICGDVKRPGLVELKCPGTVESVLALAGGVFDSKIKFDVLLYSPDSSGLYEQAQALIDYGSVSTDYLVSPGDLVIIRQRRR